MSETWTGLGTEQHDVRDHAAVAAPPSATWLPETGYTAGQLVVSTGQMFQAIDTHTSSAAFATDRTAHWRLVAPGEIVSASVAADVVMATTGDVQIIPGLTLPSFATGDRPVLLRLVVPSVKHAVAQATGVGSIGIWDGLVPVGAFYPDLTTASRVDHGVAEHRVAPNTSALTYSAYVYMPSNGNLTIAASQWVKTTLRAVQE